MRIDGRSGLDIYDAAAGNKAHRFGAASERSTQSQASHDVVITAVPQRYVLGAMAAEEVDLAAVAEAKRLIAAGQLDTPDAIARVADTIVDRGI